MAAINSRKLWMSARSSGTTFSAAASCALYFAMAAVSSAISSASVAGGAAPDMDGRGAAEGEEQRERWVQLQRVICSL